MSFNIYPLTYRNPILLLTAKAACFYSSVCPPVSPSWSRAWGSCAEPDWGFQGGLEVLNVSPALGNWTYLHFASSLPSPCCLFAVIAVRNEPASSCWMIVGWEAGETALGWLEPSPFLSVGAGFLSKLRRMNWNVFPTSSRQLEILLK